jgi:hypothetical protein
LAFGLKRLTFLFLLIVLTVSVSSVVAKRAMDNSALASHPATRATGTIPNTQPPPIIIPPTDIPPPSGHDHDVDDCTHDGDNHDIDPHNDHDDQGEDESSAEQD